MLVRVDAHISRWSLAAWNMSCSFMTTLTVRSVWCLSAALKSTLNTWSDVSGIQSISSFVRGLGDWKMYTSELVKYEAKLETAGRVERECVCVCE